LIGFARWLGRRERGERERERERGVYSEGD
jgi:hypothetical protein